MPLDEWQYGGSGDGITGLQFVDNYYNNASGNGAYTGTLHPVSYYIWGGGGGLTIGGTLRIGAIGHDERALVLGQDAGQIFFRNSGAVVVKAYPDRIVAFAQTNAERAFIARLADRLLGVHDQVQKHLHQLMGIA